MERMLRRIAIRKDGTISMSEFRKFAEKYQGKIDKLEEENRKLKEEKDFFYKSAKQFREDAESWRKECERLLGLQLCGKTIAERIEEDKKVVRE